MHGGGRSTARTKAAVAVGLGLTLMVTVADRLGGFDALERRAADWRFAHAPRAARRLTSELCFCDIDDAALDIGGRWPWPRQKLALALGELARAGARVLALDLLLTEAEHADAGAGDAALARVLAATPALVPVDLGDQDERASVPTPHRDALVAAIARHWTAPPEELIASLAPPPALAREFLARPHTFKKLAAMRRLAELARTDADGVSLAEVEAALVGTAAVTHREQQLLSALVQQHAAWIALKPRLLPGGVSAPPFARAPVQILAEQARATGFVNFRPDPDGGLRLVEAARDAPGGRALQLGIAAAALHLGLPVAPLRMDDRLLHVGERVLPLVEGRLLLCWPKAPDAGAADGTDDGWLRIAPHYSLGRALDVAEARARADELRTRAADLAHSIAADSAIEAGAGSLTDGVREETRFRLDEAARLARESHLTEEEEGLLAPFRAFAALEQALAEGEREITRSEQELKAAFEGRLVFVGWTATGAASDFVPTPLGARTPGVVAHAVAADMVLGGHAVTVTPSWATPLLALLLGALASAATLLPLWASVLAVAALLGGYGGINAALLFAVHERLVPLAAPLAAGALAWIGGIALQVALARRDQQRITRQFKTRTAPELVDFLVNHPDSLSMAGEPREVTCFFLDLAGFTSISEKLGAQQTVALLNRCMREATRQLTRHGAYVNKYLGDGLMAFWSAFKPEPDQAARACRAALSVMDGLAHVVDQAQVSARVGIATGRVIVGDCGAPPLLNDYTAIGDAINLSSRLESANKQFGTKVLVDGRTRQQVRADDLRFRNCGRVVVVGQTVPIDLYEVVAAEVPPALVALTERAVEAWRGGRLKEARALFQELDRDHGPSKLARVYLDAVAEAETTRDFDGVLRLRAK